MKKILIILFTFIALSVSAQNTHKQSNANTVEQFQGAVETKVGLINAHFSDTAEANLSWIKTKPFAQIVTGDGLTWLRNGTATRWIGTGTASISVSPDSTSIIICNGSGSCDTIPVLTVAPITNFTILNDTTIEVCGINSCDTIYTLPINYNQNVVNSVSVVNGVSVDSVFYFINGVKYLAGTITHSNNTSVDGRISGGTVSWSGAGLTFNIQAAVFRIFGVTYYTRDTTITLDPADPTYSRIDLFALDTTNGGEVIKITGTPSPTPIAPQTQDFQIALTTGITLNVGDTVPSNVSIQKIYDENIEWATSTDRATVDFNNTTFPYTGSKDAFVSSYANIGRLVFTRSGTGVIDGSEVLRFRISLNSPLRTKKLSIAFFHGAGSTLSSNIIGISSNNGLDPNKVGQYQTITIPVSYFQWSDYSYNRIILYISDYDTSFVVPFYLDDMELQTGVNNIPQQVDYSSKVDSTTIKKINDSTYIGLYWIKGISYQKGDTVKIHSIATVGDIDVLQNTIDSSSFGIKKLDGTVKNVVVYADGLTGVSGGGTQVNSDWNATSGVAEILNKPTIPAQFNPIAGTNVTITGTYPNLTFNSTASGGVGTVTDFNFTNSTGITGTVTNSTTTPTLSLVIDTSAILNFSTKVRSIFNATSPIIYSNGNTSLDTTVVHSSAYNNATYQGKLTLTTTGTSGAATLTGNTLNIPQYSGGTYTASNGLTAVGNDIQLGGNLLATTTIMGADQDFVITNTRSSYRYALEVLAPGTSNRAGLHVTGQDFAIVGEGASHGIIGRGSNYGVIGEATGNSGFGVQAFSIDGVSLLAQAQSSTGTGIQNMISIVRQYSGSPTNGVGASISYQIPTVGGSYINQSNELISKWTDATDATRTSEFSITGVNSATTQTLLKISGAGVFTLVQGLTNYTDNAAAIAGGLTVGQLYRNGDIVQIVH